MDARAAVTPSRSSRPAIAGAVDCRRAPPLSSGPLLYRDLVDASEFRVDSLHPGQYNALVTLIESYFAAGYEWFTPSALRPADQETLRQRFEN